MRKKSRRFLFLIMLILAVILTVCSCGRTKVVFTTGLGKHDIFRIDSKICTYPEAMVVLTNIKNQYENMFEDDIWHEEFNGQTLEDYVKEETIQRLSRIKCMDLLAKEKNITLTEKEQEKVKKAAKEYYSSLNQDEITYMEVDEDILVNLYEQYALAAKAYDNITKNVQEEVSDDEARVATVQQVFVKYTDDMDSARKEAKKILKKAKEGEDFTRLTDLNPDRVQGTITFGRGDMPDVYVEAAFELEEGQISDVIKTEEGYYIIKCICRLERSLTDENRKKIMKERRESVFRNEYDSFVSELSSEFNDEAWEEVTLIKNDKIITTSFFDMYKRYFQ